MLTAYFFPSTGIFLLFLSIVMLRHETFFISINKTLPLQYARTDLSDCPIRARYDRVNT